ncbi:hypothetical protein PIIN_01653 [Serendipita indica DSM 11827]|uniref:Uncharacterized protein n=1 Tax=Serendipita indica (strain DSM 11827) TaxID=1109443 RepID=G4T940_SERID|nr:hypothetical protein PIIN_01653 [Serendipita indica DSM 11827]
MSGRLCSRGLQRSFATSTRVLNSPTSQSLAAKVAPIEPIAPAPPPRRVGGVRGGIFGFLFGFSLASAYASYALLDEYRLASAVLQSSIHVSAHVRRIETVEKELKALTERTAEKNDVSKLRAEMKQLYDGLHIEFLDLRAHVWGLREYHFSSSTFA